MNMQQVFQWPYRCPLKLTCQQKMHIPSQLARVYCHLEYAQDEIMMTHWIRNCLNKQMIIHTWCKWVFIKTTRKTCHRTKSTAKNLQHL